MSQADLTQLLHWIRPDQSLKVGRDGLGTDMRIRQDSKLSGTHFEVYGDGHDFHVRDLGSSNGTYVDGERVTEMVLRHGDMIQAGETTFSVALLGRPSVATESPEPPQPDSAEASPPTTTSTAETSTAETNLAETDLAAGQEVTGITSPKASVGIGGEMAAHPDESAPAMIVEDARPSAAEDGTTPASVMQVIVKIESGPFRGIERENMTRLLHWIRPGQSTRFGRTHKSDFVIRQDNRLSSRHFEISSDGNTCVLRDLGSTNGTEVNHRRVTESQLHDGDLVKAGSTTFSISIDGGAEPARSPAVSPNEDALLSSDRLLQTDRFEAVAAVPSDDSSGRPMQVVLNVISGPFSDFEKNCLSRLLSWIRAGQTVTVGRGRIGAGLAIDYDTDMSSPHFELFCDGQKCQIRDLGSRNGTFVNGVKIRETTLRDGNEIRAGQTIFGVSVQGGRAITDTEIEFSMIEADAEESNDDIPLPLPSVPNVDTVFAEIKAKLKRRGG